MKYNQIPRKYIRANQNIKDFEGVAYCKHGDKGDLCPICTIQHNCEVCGKPCHRDSTGKFTKTCSTKTENACLVKLRSKNGTVNNQSKKGWAFYK